MGLGSPLGVGALKAGLILNRSVAAATVNLVVKVMAVSLFRVVRVFIMFVIGLWMRFVLIAGFGRFVGHGQRMGMLVVVSVDVIGRVLLGIIVEVAHVGFSVVRGQPNFPRVNNALS
jgi:hypothetical protein